MISNEQYQNQYPYLAYFAQASKDSPTYTRKTKTGKTVIVRKGKRKGQNKLVSTAGGVGVGLLAGNLVKRPLMNAVIAGLDKGILDPQNINHQRAIGYGGTAAILGTAIGGGILTYKKLRGDRKK